MVRWASNGATAPEPTKAVCRSGTPATTGMPGRTPSSSATSGTMAEDAAGREQVWQLGPVAPGTAEQFRDVAEWSATAIVGQPGEDHRCRRRSQTPTQAHPQIVERFEQRLCARVQRWFAVAQEQMVAQRVGAVW